MNNRQLLLIFLINVSLISLIYAAKVTTLKPTTTKSTNTTVTTKSKTNSTGSLFRIGNRKVITTRLGADGNPEAACECTLFYLCDKDNVVNLPSTSSETCDSSSVCCAVPISILGGDDYNPVSSSSPPAVTSFSESTPSQEIPTSNSPSTSGQSCVCVPFYQCMDYDPLVATAGAGLIDPRIPCSVPDICCPANQVNTSADNGGTGTSQQPITIPPTITPSPEPVITPSPPPPSPSPEECGIRRGQAIDTRVVSPDASRQTAFGEFPWMALVLTTEIAPNGTRTENVFVCGASLLSPFIVLTAAHCVNDANISLLKIRVGEYNTQRGIAEPLPHQDRPISAIHVHPNFNSRVLFNDLALLSVTEPFELATHISPICIPLMNTQYAASNAYNPNQCLATGWGKNAFAEGDFQHTLRKVDLTIIPRDQCQTQLRTTRLGQAFQLDNSFICAGGQPGFDTCQGDGGGPLFCASTDNPNRYIQVGIVSWGIGCANNVPGVYASLEANREWLTTEFNSLTVFRRG